MCTLHQLVFFKKFQKKSKIFTEAPLGILFVIGRPNDKKMQPVIKTKGLQSVTCDC